MQGSYHSKIRGWRAFLLVLLVVGVAGSGGSVQGYLPAVDTIWEWVEERSPVITSAIITAQVTVFAKSSGEGAIPQENRSRSWKQKVYWIAAEQFLGVESFSLEGKLQHIYVRDGSRERQRQLAGGPWSVWDIQPPYVDLLSNRAADWKNHLGFWGINPQQTSLARHPKLGYLLLLGEGSQRSLWLSQDPFRAVRLETLIHDKRGAYALVQHYDNFMVLTNGKLSLPQSAYFPSQVSYTLNGRLFKQWRVLSLEKNPSRSNFPLQRLRQEVAN